MATKYPSPHFRDIMTMMVIIITLMLSMIMSSLAFANENLQSYKLIVLSFDGFRNDYIDPERTPNLFAVANAGVQGHMKSTFVTKTYPNHQSIATGLYQPWHGIVNNHFYDPDMKAFFDVDSPSSAWWDQKNISVPIYIANQFYNRNQRYSISIQWPGSIASYSNGKNSDDRMRVHYLQDFDPSIDWYKRIDLLLSWLQHPLRPANMAFVYFSEPDRHAHEYGPFSTEVLDQVKKLDSVVGYLRQKLLNANLAHRTNVIYLSDHGMAEVRAERSFFIDKCDQEYSGLKYELIGVSPVYSLRPISKPLSINGTLEQSVREALNQCAIKHFENSFKVYLLDEIPENFYYRDNNRILSMILLAKDGYDINYKDHHWRPKGYPIWGNHGYNNSEPSMRPLFLAQGPRFKRSYKHSKLFENVDLYPLMLNLLEIPIEQFPSNGSFERVQQMLSKELYLDADDILQRNSISSSSNQTWVRFLIVLSLGFVAILMAGLCLVLSAAISKHSSTNQKRLRDCRNNLNRLLQKSIIINDIDDEDIDGDRNETIAMISSRNSHHDFDNGIGMKQQPLISKSDDKLERLQNQSSNIRNDEIDWDIIGTGLDIDLASQLEEKRNISIKKNRYYDHNDDWYVTSDQESRHQKNRSDIVSNRNEFVSLLIQDDNDDNEDEDSTDGSRKIETNLIETIADNPAMRSPRLIDI